MSWRKKAIEVAQEKIAADLVVVDGKLVNVYSDEIYQEDVAIIDGRIAKFGEIENVIDSETVVINADGCFLVPGLIDSHIHTESSGVTLTELSKVLLARGITTIMYAHEIANLFGVKGLEIVREESKNIPLKVFFQAPTSVPWAPGLETTGVNLTPDDVKEILDWEETVSLGESDYFDLIDCEKEILEKIQYARDKNKIVNGHAAAVTGKKLMAAVAGGFNDDHENYSAEEVINKIRLGMKVLLREANIPQIVPDLVDKTFDTGNLLLCIDDKLINTLVEEGGIDNTVRCAIEHGFQPLDAIKMATINIASHFRKNLDLGGIAPGKIADILITDSLENLNPNKVIANGKLVAKNGEFISEISNYKYPAWTKNAVSYAKPEIKEDDLNINIEAKIKKEDYDKAEVNVLNLEQGGWVKTWTKEIIPLKNGKLNISPEGPYNYVASIERHGKNGDIGLGIVKGIGLKCGALASTVGHDSHNLTIIGTNAKDMSLCASALKEIGGGFIAVNQGEILATVELGIGGLLSQASYHEVARKINEFEDKIVSILGFPEDIELVVLNFIVLQSSPFEAAITDQGLIDVYSREVMKPIVSYQ